MTTDYITQRSQERMVQYQRINRLAVALQEYSMRAWRNPELSAWLWGQHFDVSVLALRALRGEFQRPLPWWQERGSK